MSRKIARICENGHVLTVSVTEYTDVGNYCEKCGAKGIDHCQNCGTPIPGTILFWASSFRPPKFCHTCGKPYPWTGKIAEVVETPQARWVEWTSPLYWFLAIRSKCMAVFFQLRRHRWSIIEVLTVALVLIGIATLVVFLVRAG